MRFSLSIATALATLSTAHAVSLNPPPSGAIFSNAESVAQLSPKVVLNYVSKCALANTTSSATMFADVPDCLLERYLTGRFIFADLCSPPPDLDLQEITTALQAASLLCPDDVSDYIDSTATMIFQVYNAESCWTSLCDEHGYGDDDDDGNDDESSVLRIESHFLESCSGVDLPYPSNDESEEQQQYRRRRANEAQMKQLIVKYEPGHLDECMASMKDMAPSLIIVDQESLEEGDALVVMSTPEDMQSLENAQYVEYLEESVPHYPEEPVPRYLASADDDVLLTCMLDHVMNTPASDFGFEAPPVQCYPPAYDNVESVCLSSLAKPSFDACAASRITNAMVADEDGGEWLSLLIDEGSFSMSMSMSMSMSYDDDMDDSMLIVRFCSILQALTTTEGLECLDTLCTGGVTMAPSSVPSTVPSMSPSSVPSTVPSMAPSSVPSTAPSMAPSSVPSTSPSMAPISSPVRSPTSSSSVPSTAPSKSPVSTFVPSIAPSRSPVSSSVPSTAPSKSPVSTFVPSIAPSRSPVSSSVPSTAPSKSPVSSSVPSTAPSSRSPVSSSVPSTAPSTTPVSGPFLPSTAPSTSPVSSPVQSTAPSMAPVSPLPSTAPSMAPVDSSVPSTTPSAAPTSSSVPSIAPSKSPSAAPSTSPSASPTASPSAVPSSSPSASPTLEDVQQVVEVEVTSRLSLNVPTSATNLPELFSNVVEKGIVDSLSSLSDDDVIVTILSINGDAVRRRRLQSSVSVEFRVETTVDCYQSDCEVMADGLVVNLKDALSDAATDGSMTSSIQAEAESRNVDELKSTKVIDSSYEFVASDYELSDPEDPVTTESSGAVSLAMTSAIALLVVSFALLA